MSDEFVLDAPVPRGPAGAVPSGAVEASCENEVGP